ncbi:kinase-like domain-containing protein [Morchella snyderi]|nr:kinase-like domain-containing protein [Morchella snyderi]
MAASVSNFDNFKLPAEFHAGGLVVHGEAEKWRQVRSIGSGAYGSVFLQKKECEQELDEDDAFMSVVGHASLRAVKKVALHLLPMKGQSQELLVLLRLTNYSTHFVKFLGWYDNPEFIFYAMEYIKGGDLHSYMTQDRVGASRDAKEITRQILEGLVVLQKENICHRDLKPQNILIASLEPIWVKIADFGVAKWLEGTVPRTDGQGTGGYRAPELIGFLPGLKGKRRQQNAHIGYALDIWSLGALVHELLTSYIPFFDRVESDSESEEMTDVQAVKSSTSTFRQFFDSTSLHEFCHQEIEFPTNRLLESGVNSEGIAFVKSLLLANPVHRPEPLSALHGPLLCSWIGGVVGEFLSMGVDLDLRYFQEAQWVGKEGGTCFLQCLPISERGRISALLQKAVSKGYVSATSMLLGIPSGELASPLTSLDYSEAFLQAIELQKADLVELFLRRSTFDDDIEGTFESKEFLKMVTLEEPEEEEEGGELCLRNYRNILRFAITSGHISTVKILLQVNFSINKASKDYENQSGFLLAVKGGHIAIVKLLLEAGVDINAEAASDDGPSQTALQAATVGGHEDIVRLLHEAGADTGTGKVEDRQGTKVPRSREIDQWGVVGGERGNTKNEQSGVAF